MPSSPSLRRGGDSLVGGLDPVTSFHFGPVERGIGPCDERLDRGQRRAACHTGADRRRNVPAVEHAAGRGKSRSHAFGNSGGIGGHAW